MEVKMKTFRFMGLLLCCVVLTGCFGVPEPLPQGPDAVWDLVIIGDSSLRYLGDAYATVIEEDMGIEVEVHDFTPMTATAGGVLEILAGNTFNNFLYESLEERLSEAEVVVMWVNPEASVDPKNPLDMEGCFIYQAPKNCQPETFDSYIDDVKDIWRQIIKLRRGKETILRAVDFYNPLLDRWIESGVQTACTECWDNLSDAVRSAAEAYDIPLLSVYDAFGGPEHNEDPRLKGFIDEDGRHPSELGAEYTAELLGAMGYEPTIP